MLRIFSVFDSKASAFIQPFYSPTRGTAIRSFKAMANEPGHAFNLFPDDYTLFELGTFDPETAKFDLQATPESLGLANFHQEQE